MPSCPGPSGSCYGENGELAFTTKSFGSLQAVIPASGLDASPFCLAPHHVFHAAELPPAPADDTHYDTVVQPVCSSSIVGAGVLTTTMAATTTTTTVVNDVTMSWDDGETDFAMDMDMDIDFDFDALGT